MGWYRHHWQNVGLVVAVAALAYLAIGWGSLDIMQRVLLASFVVLLLHEFEEWGWPRGEPAILNMAINDSRAPDRYPSNAKAQMVVNVFAPYPIYILAVIFSSARRTSAIRSCGVGPGVARQPRVVRHTVRQQSLSASPRTPRIGIEIRRYERLPLHGPP